MMLDDEELNMLATLRINCEFMKFMQEHFGIMSLDDLKKLDNDAERDIKHLSEQQIKNTAVTEDINNAADKETNLCSN